jgi:hypothetical protein
LLALQNLNIDPTQARLTFLTIPGTEMNRRLALETGSVDATTLRGSVGDLYGDKGYNILYNFKDAGVTLPQNMLVTTRRTATAKPLVIEGYLKAMIEAIAFTVDPANKELVTRLLASNLRLPNPAAAEESYHSVVNSYEPVPRISLDGMKRLQRLLVQVNPKIAGVRVEGVIDNSFMNKLEGSGYVRACKNDNAFAAGQATQRHSVKGRSHERKYSGDCCRRRQRAEAAVAAKQVGAPKVVMLEKRRSRSSAATRGFRTPAFAGFSGADEIRSFLPAVDDALFRKLHLPAYSANSFI